MKSSPRKLCGVLVTGELIAEMARSGERRYAVESQLPESAVFHTAYFDQSRNAFVCVFEDDSFPPLDNASIPIIDKPVIRMASSATNG